MTFAGAIKQGLQKSFDFKGSARRSEYWYFALFVFLVQIVLGVADAFVQVATGTKFGWLANIASVLLVLPQLALLARRFHDAGLSAKWLFTQLVPLIALIWALPAIMAFGDVGDTPSDAELQAFFSAFAPLMLSLMAVGIFTLTVSLLPSKSHLSGNRFVEPLPGDPTQSELKNQGW